MTEIKLDLLDKKILNALNQNVRAQYSEIAKKVRSSKEVVNYRIKRLIDNGIIKEFVTIFGLGYWAHKILIQFEKIDGEEEKELIEYLVNHPNTNWVTPCSGNWDLVLAIMAKDPAHFDKVLRKILARIGPFLQDYKISTSIGSQTFGHTYILGSVKEDKKIHMEVRKKIKLDFDEKDKKIAKILHANARAKLTEISAATKIPIDTVKYRIKKMEENLIIRRYRLILDPAKLGYNRYEIFIRCVNLTDPLITKFKEYSKQNPNVEYFSRCVGSWDIELTVHFKTNTELRSFVLDIKKEFGDYIKNFESVSLFNTYNFIYFPEELR
ncbi:Lrp/AsnC family transcriptional regulator [Candidatus Woesearchaeota archaeon]|nr:Lrp/AsnC family transcriptional regulator [Candidatus Woesearchaeota archaeon]MBT6520285.1 Lrp/AsnC family transcriptional regulator [Candidatus Woesearchaeota archaeon]